MFGGMLALKRAAEDAYRTLDRLRQGYARLKELEPDKSLLSLLKLTEDPTKPAPHPELCPVNCSYQFTPAFVERYVSRGETLQEKVWAMGNEDTVDDMVGGLKYTTELTRYTADLELEVRRIQTQER